MGSNSASIGNFAGKVLYTFNVSGSNVGEDTGPLSFMEVPPFYKARTFQLVGSGTGFSIMLYFTLDQATAQNAATTTNPTNTPYWDPIPAPSTETTPQWSNPMTDAAGTRAFFTNAPFAAVRAVSSANAPATISGRISLVMLAAS